MCFRHKLLSFFFPTQTIFNDIYNFHQNLNFAQISPLFPTFFPNLSIRERKLKIDPFPNAQIGQHLLSEIASNVLMVGVSFLVKKLITDRKKKKEHLIVKPIHSPFYSESKRQNVRRYANGGRPSDERIKREICFFVCS